MAQVKGQSAENKIGRRLRGGGRGSIVFQQDYQFMCEHMIYGETPSFTSLIESIKMLNGRIQQLNYQKQ